MSAPACKLQVREPDLGISRKCRGHGRKVLVVAGAVAGELPIGPVCGPHLRSVYATHGHLVVRVELAPDVVEEPDPAGESHS